MKFLCDNCKAKYQIADEKVAGKTVRMKCRKCGHQIEVRAAVTETSVSTSSPMGGTGTEMMRPAGNVRGGLATSLSAQKPRAPAPSQPAGAPGTGPYAAQGALAGAFQRAVSEPPQTMPMPPAGNNPVELSVTDEWYVAINGVPVGPVRITELRRKAASGAVTEDSLCWQEGLEEWRPVRSIPELAALVREAAQGNRPSLISPEASPGRISSPPAPPRPPVGATGPQRPANAPMAPRAAPAPSNPQLGGPVTSPSPQRSNVVPLRTAANLAGLDEIGGPSTSPLGGAVAALAPTYQPTPQPPPPALIPSDPFAIPAPPPYASAPAVSASDPFAIPAPAPTGPMGGPPMAPVYSPSMLPPAPRRAVPLWFWPILLFTGMFGAAAAFFVFKQQPPPAPVVIQLAPTASAAPTSTVASEVPPPASAEPTAPTASASSGTKIASAGKTATTAAGGAPTATAKGLDLGGLVPSGGGPNVGGAGGGGPGTGGGLDSSSVQRVVASHQNGVKRTCWERGGAGGTSSANVTISAQVGPAGNVVGTSSTGDDPVVAKCIENQVKTWMFAAPGSTTTVNIPFKFIKQ